MKELIIVQTFNEDGFLTGYEVKGEVVRCNDCVHKYVCPMYGGSQFFCAYGEKGEANEQNKSQRSVHGSDRN